MQLGSTRPAAKKHLPKECNPTAEWHYFSTIQQAIAGAILFSPTRNRWLKWLRLHAAHDHGVWDLAGLWALMINDDQWIDHDWPWTQERMTSHTWFCKEEWLDHGHKSTECKRKHRQSTLWSVSCNWLWPLWPLWAAGRTTPWISILSWSQS